MNNPPPSYSVDAAGVASLLIEGGGPLNIISSVFAAQLASTLESIAANAQVRAVVLRGSGHKTFVGGADLREMAALDPPGARRFIGALHRLCEAARDMPVPTIAAIDGWCIGVGLELAAACDLRVATDVSQFTMPEVRIGIPSVIQGALLSRLIGEGRARWLMLTGRAIDAPTALQWGLVNDVVPRTGFDGNVAELARELAGLGAAGMHAQKRVLRQSEAPHLDTAMRLSMLEFGTPFETGEPHEAMTAFLNHRKAGA